MENNEETKYCSNCKRDIAAANYVMHEVHCKRNIILCAKCGEPIPRTEQESHDEEYHKLVECDLCHKQFEVAIIDEHKEDCPKRKVHCPYCEIDCPRDGLDEHMEYCGTRTEPCEKCAQFIMHKDKAKHEDTNCAFPAPPPSTNQNSSTSTNQNEFGLGNGGFGIHSDFHDVGSFRSDELMRLMEPHASFLPPRQRPINFANFRSRPAFPDRSVGPPLRPAGPRRMDGRGRFDSSSTRPVISKQNDLKPNNSNIARKQERLKKKPQNTSQSKREPDVNLNLSENDDVVSARPDRDEIDRLLAVQLGNGLALETADFNNLDLHQFDEIQGAGAESDFDQRGFYPLDADVSMEDSFQIPIQTNGGAAGDDVSVPCEFCNEPFPLQCLIQHQSGCDKAPASLFTEVNERDESNGIRFNNEASRQSNDERRQVPLIDNMASLYTQDDGLGTDGFGDDVLIPCEFCDELYPSDMLIVHQPVCDRNFSKTPRTRTPKVTNQQAALRGQRGGLSRVPRHQPDPRLGFLQSETSVGAAGSSRGRSSYAKYGKKITRSSYATGSRNQTPELRRQKSADKVRQTLNSLVADPTDRPLNLGPSNHGHPTSDRSIGAPASEETSPGYDPSFAAGSHPPRQSKSRYPRK